MENDQVTPRGEIKRVVPHVWVVVNLSYSIHRDTLWISVAGKKSILPRICLKTRDFRGICQHVVKDIGGK